MKKSNVLWLIALWTVIVSIITPPTIMILSAASLSTSPATGPSASNQQITCSGTVLDGQGRPLPGATVVFYLSQTDHPKRSTKEIDKQEMTTAANGEFSFHTTPKIPQPDITWEGYIVAQKEGLPYQWAFWDLQKNLKVNIRLSKTKFPLGGPVDLTAPQLIEKIIAAENKIQNLQAQYDYFTTKTDGSHRLAETIKWGRQSDPCKEYFDITDYNDADPESNRPAYTIKTFDIYDLQKNQKHFFGDGTLHYKGEVILRERQYHISLFDKNKEQISHLRPINFMGYDLFSGNLDTLSKILIDSGNVTIRKQLEQIDDHSCTVLEVLDVKEKTRAVGAMGEIYLDQVWDFIVWIDIERDCRPLRIEIYDQVEGGRHWERLTRVYEKIILNETNDVWLPAAGESWGYYTHRIFTPLQMTAQEFSRIPTNLQNPLKTQIRVPFDTSPSFIKVQPETVKINQTIDPKIYIINPPANCRVYDDINGTQYHIPGFDDPKYIAQTPAERILKQLQNQTAWIDPKMTGDFIAVLHDFDVRADKQKWCAAVRALTLIGSPAVDDITKELKITQNPPTQSSLAFTLRIINDRRAVPALIDALDHPAPNLNYDLENFPDNQLFHFMKENEKSLIKTKKTVFIGRPVREITLALEAITQHSEGYEHFDDITKSPQVAQRWRIWWDKQ